MQKVWLWIREKQQSSARKWRSSQLFNKNNSNFFDDSARNSSTPILNYDSVDNNNNDLSDVLKIKRSVSSRKGFLRAAETGMSLKQNEGKKNRRFARGNQTFNNGPSTSSQEILKHENNFGFKQQLKRRLTPRPQKSGNNRKYFPPSTDETNNKNEEIEFSNKLVTSSKSINSQSRNFVENNIEKVEIFVNGETKFCPTTENNCNFNNATPTTATAMRNKNSCREPRDEIRQIEKDCSQIVSSFLDTYFL